MDATQIIKSSQEQGVAAWIAYLNQLRIEKLMHALMAQDVHLKEALHELAQAKIDVFGLIESNRGGTKGMHGFIAERAQVGIENARNLVTGQQARRFGSMIMDLRTSFVVIWRYSRSLWSDI